jgi:hypothetical protein
MGLLYADIVENFRSQNFEDAGERLNHSFGLTGAFARMLFRRPIGAGGLCFAPLFITTEAVNVADEFPLFSDFDRYFGRDRNLTLTLKAEGVRFPR